MKTPVVADQEKEPQESSFSCWTVSTKDAHLSLADRGPGRAPGMVTLQLVAAGTSCWPPPPRCLICRVTCWVGASAECVFRQLQSNGFSPFQWRISWKQMCIRENSVHDTPTHVLCYGIECIRLLAFSVTFSVGKHAEPHSLRLDMCRQLWSRGSAIRVVSETENGLSVVSAAVTPDVEAWTRTERGLDGS